ncbi:FMN-binding protein [Microbacterium sp. 4R-513]|uniref:FMN-binding protein n=1 Tax=Microbacterium sp. 4R-513 TaxID=2567934 RepID=UPI0013E1232A|nr:FMN-binding protein [Microbacterium sp. 4R-513]QIG40857.1 FMN-binding protein [Microbacterium sp. 4R-513]
MKRIVYAVLATVTGLVLLFSYRTSLEAVPPVAAGTADAGATGSSSDTGSTGSHSSGSTDPGTTDGSGSAEDSTDSSGSSESSGSTGSSASTRLADGTYTGSAASTRFGPVQVQITVSGGTITAAEAVDYPTENRRDQEINQIAIPRLVSETLAAQSSEIDMISGATYTSDGYIQSLQSAIDQATS